MAPLQKELLGAEVRRDRRGQATSQFGTPALSLSRLTIGLRASNLIESFTKRGEHLPRLPVTAVSSVQLRFGGSSKSDVKGSSAKLSSLQVCSFARSFPIPILFLQNPSEIAHWTASFNFRRLVLLCLQVSSNCTSPKTSARHTFCARRDRL